MLAAIRAATDELALHNLGQHDDLILAEIQSTLQDSNVTPASFRADGNEAITRTLILDDIASSTGSTTTTHATSC